MRLWHQELIPKLPNQWLLGQHRELCALRGNAWGRKHSTVDYVFQHDFERLVAFHWIVIGEMSEREINFTRRWLSPYYRGQKIGYEYSWIDTDAVELRHTETGILGFPIYPEHNDEYYNFCVEKLRSRGVNISHKEK